MAGSISSASLVNDALAALTSLARSNPRPAARSRSTSAKFGRALTIALICWAARRRLLEIDRWA